MKAVVYVAIVHVSESEGAHLSVVTRLFYRRENFYSTFAKLACGGVIVVFVLVLWSIVVLEIQQSLSFFFLHFQNLMDSECVAVFL